MTLLDIANVEEEDAPKQEHNTLSNRIKLNFIEFNLVQYENRRIIKV